MARYRATINGKATIEVVPTCAYDDVLTGEFITDAIVIANDRQTLWHCGKLGTTAEESLQNFDEWITSLGFTRIEDDND